MSLLASLSRDDELRAAISEYQARDGYDIVVVNGSMTYSLISDDKPFIREFANQAMRRFGDSAFIVYQAHRSLLWAGDIGGSRGSMPCASKKAIKFGNGLGSK